MHSESENLVEEGALVSLHFALALPTGDVIDSNFDRQAVSFRVGDGNLLPGFEDALIGLRPGSELEVTIPAVDAFGEVNPKNLQVFPLEKFSHLLEDDLIPTEIGSVVSFKDAGGFDLAGVIHAISKSTITVDFNHPLAGKNIVFKAAIHAVIPPTVDTLEVKL